ncbi:MAG: HTH domain-containing protein [Bacteroidota bacterium]
MKSASNSNTILLWTKNQHIRRLTSEIAVELNLSIYNVEEETDLIAVPCFLMILDTEKLKDDFLSDFNGIAKHMDSGVRSILVVGKRLLNLPFHVKLLVTYANRTITKDYLLKIINTARDIKRNVKQDMFKERIHRIIFLYKLLDEGKVIATKEMGELFEMSDRTLRRDIKILRAVCDKEIVFDKDSGYYFLP